MSISKAAGEAITTVMNKISNTNLSPSAKTAAIQIGKWGAIPAAAGAGIGLGAAAAGAGVSAGFGADPSDTTGSITKISGWVIALLIIAVILIVFAPKIKAVLK